MLAVKGNMGDIVVALLDKLEEDISLTPLEKQFFINAQNKEGNTALHEACLKDYQTITEKIEQRGLKFGLDLGLKNKKGLTIEDIKELNKKKRINKIEE
jgi:ankyrin repeat protein